MLKLRDARNGRAVVVSAQPHHPLPATLRGALSYGSNGTWYRVQWNDGTTALVRDEYVTVAR